MDTGQDEMDIPASPIRRTSFIVSHAECAATTLGPRTPMWESHSAGLMPVAFLWSLTSPRVSDRCMFMGAPTSSENAFASVHVSSLHT